MILPCITLFDNEGEIDYVATCSHADWLIEAGVHGLVIVGNCGEFFTLDIEEREQLAEAVVEKVGGRIPVYVGVTHTSTRTAIRLSRHAKLAGATGIMSESPYYSSARENEIVTYFRDLADSVDLPFIVCNNPGTSGFSLNDTALASLAYEGVAKLIKESHGDPTRIHDLRLQVPDQTPLLYGEDYGAFEAIAVGADGWLAGAGNFMPRHSIRLWDLVRSGDLAGARRHWFKILPLVNMASHKSVYGHATERPHFIQIYKAVLEMIGRRGGPCRRPLLPLPDRDLVYLRSLVDDILLSLQNA